MLKYKDYEIEDEYPRHRKSPIIKKNKVKKADHKHVYQDCIASFLAEDSYGMLRHLYSKAQYCTICGKLDCNWMKTTILGNGNTLPVFEVEMYDKIINL